MATTTELQLSATTGISVSDLQEIKRRRGLDDATLVVLPSQSLQRLASRLRLPDLPMVRLHYLSLRHRDAQGRLPGVRQLSDRRDAALALRRHPPGSAAGLRTGAPEAAAAPSVWKERGPNNIGGRTRSLLPHPHVPHLVYAGSVGGGVWRSTDDGQTWFPMDDRMANLAICCMAIAPDGALFAGTGEGFGNIDALCGNGIFVCPSGVAWYQLTSTRTDDFKYVNRIAITTAQVILAATTTGLMRSTDNGISWKKTLNGNLADAKAHPTNPNRAVVGSRDGKAYYTINGGVTWTSSKPASNWGLGRIELAYAAANPDIVYASVNNNGGEIWVSNDGGVTFTKRATLSGGAPARYLGAQGWYDNVIWAGMPNDPDFVLVGGIDLWRSTDGGASLNRISLWSTPGSAHADHHVIAPAKGFDGNTNNAVYFGNDGGIYRADDVRTVGAPTPQSGWTNLNRGTNNENGYAVTQFYYGAGNSASGQIVAGAQDNGTLSNSDSTSQAWFSMFGGDGGDCAADPGDPATFYGEYVYLQIFRATNQPNSGDYIWGQYWNGTSWQPKPPPYNLPDAGSNLGALFIAPFVIDPGQPNRLLAGGLSLWRTNDAKTPNTPGNPNSGPQWASIKPPLPSSAKVSAIHIASSDSDIVLVGYSDGSIWRSTNATTNAPDWTKLGGNLFQGLFCTSVLTDPTNADVCYVTFGGYSANVYRCDISINVWTDITPPDLEMPAHSLAVHPNNNQWIYLGTDAGLWVSEDRGNTWQAGNAAPSNCAIFDLFWMGTSLVVVTHGRGVFTVDLSHTFNPAPPNP